jgi:RNA polymerase sigma-70 factor (ECF subfamily)
MLAVYLAHRGELVNYANALVGDRSFAEDVVQEAWMRFVRATEERLPDEPVSYLYRVVRNLAIDGRRRNIRQARLIEPGTEEHLQQIADSAPSPEVSAVDKEELRLLAEVWAELPERTRIAMEMRQLGGCKLKEIAAHLGISIPVAHTIIAEGIARCRRHVRRPRSLSSAHSGKKIPPE